MSGITTITLAPVFYKEWVNAMDTRMLTCYYYHYARAQHFNMGGHYAMDAHKLPRNITIL